MSPQYVRSNLPCERNEETQTNIRGRRSMVKMADDDQSVAGTSESKYLTRSRKKKMKQEIVQISDSSSESNDEGLTSLSTTSLMQMNSTPKSIPASLESTVECPVCLQNCIHPARLPCGHIFCFLCLKGIAQQSHRCAMCRKEIPPDYLEKPDLLVYPSTNIEKETFEDGYEWFYEGRNGWWQFEERISQDLEEVQRLGITKLETLICGTLYVIDLQELVQYNKENPRRKRKIKRELISNVVVKGVAGIR